MAVFADNFADTDGVVLQSHTPDVGTSWSVLWQTSAGVDAEINTNRCRSDGTLNGGVIYTANATYPSADYDITCTLVSIVAQNDRPIYLLVRVQDQENMYAVRLETTASESSLYKKVSGTWTQIGSFFTKPADGSVIKLEIIGTALKFYDDGVVIASATVSDLSSAGKAGIAFGGGTELQNGSAVDDGSTSNIIDSLTVNDLGSSAITGTLSKTLGAVTLSATGSLALVGSASKTLANVTLSAAGTVAISGELSKTLENVTLSGAGTLPIAGSASVTLGDVSSVAAGALTIAGDLNQTLADATLSGAGALPLTGALSKTLGNATLAGAGAVAIAGALSKTLSNVTLSASGFSGDPAEIGRSTHIFDTEGSVVYPTSSRETYNTESRRSYDL